MDTERHLCVWIKKNKSYVYRMFNIKVRKMNSSMQSYNKSAKPLFCYCIIRISVIQQFSLSRINMKRVPHVQQNSSGYLARCGDGKYSKSLATVDTQNVGRPMERSVDDTNKFVGKFS